MASSSPSLCIFFLVTTFLHTTTTCTSINSSCTHTDSIPKGYINYLKFYHCNLTNFPHLAFFILLLWLITLFYLLTHTASHYFCPNVQHLSKSLNLSPSIAGTTLLPLANGSPDVFAGIFSFTPAGDGGVIGLNSILGGSIFVSNVVVGVLTLLLAYNRKTIVVDKQSFIRDVVFLLLGLSNLLVILIIGKISFWVSIVFGSSYIIYICLVCYMHVNSMKKQKTKSTTPVDNNLDNSGNYQEGPRLPLLVHCAEKVVPQRKRAMIMLFYVMGLPFSLPRRVTIPMATQERWSKPFGVISMVLAPLMLVFVFNTQEGKMGIKWNLVIYSIALVIGLALGGCTFAWTSCTMVPQRCVFVWYGSGFVMSALWTYIMAEELVSLLESLGGIIGMNSSILGLTILAWGNSLGDLTSNLAMAMHDGSNGAQIAIAGCYAGPVFNIFVGLGFSFVIACWLNYPNPYMVPVNPYLCETVGFLMCGLLWALVVLPKREMRLDRTLGGGLLVIYFCFLFIKIARAVGLLNVSNSNLLIISL